MREHVTEMNIYLSLNKIKDEDIIDKIKDLKNRRKLNGIVIKLLREYIEDKNQLDLFEKQKQS